MSTNTSPAPATRLRQALLLGAGATALALFTLAALALMPRQPAAASPAPIVEAGDANPQLLGGGPAPDVLLKEPAAVELTLMWQPGGEVFTGSCAAPVQVVARYSRGPQYRRIDCDHDGAADVWALAEQIGEADLPVEDDSHLRP